MFALHVYGAEFFWTVSSCTSEIIWDAKDQFGQLNARQAHTQVH